VFLELVAALEKPGTRVLTTTSGVFAGDDLQKNKCVLIGRSARVEEPRSRHSCVRALNFGTSAGMPAGRTMTTGAGHGSLEIVLLDMT
jgi:hypothetical protein